MPRPNSRRPPTSTSPPSRRAIISAFSLSKPKSSIPRKKKWKKQSSSTGDQDFPLLHRYLGGIYVAKQLNKEAVAELETYIHQDPNAKDADRIKQTISDLKTKLN